MNEPKTDCRLGSRITVCGIAPGGSGNSAGQTPVRLFLKFFGKTMENCSIGMIPFKATR